MFFHVDAFCLNSIQIFSSVVPCLFGSSCDDGASDGGFIKSCCCSIVLRLACTNLNQVGALCDWNLEATLAQLGSVVCCSTCIVLLFTYNYRYEMAIEVHRIFASLKENVNGYRPAPPLSLPPSLGWVGGSHQCSNISKQSKEKESKI